jgi:hypothetical protein
VFGAPPRPAEVTVVTDGLGRRVGRALAALGICWALAFPAIFLPVAHFVLVPGLVLAGPVLAVLRLRQARRIAVVHGVCPRCGVEQDFTPGGAARPSRRIDCPRCRNELTLTLEEAAEPAASSPSSTP